MKTANQVELESKIIEFNGLKKRVPLRKRMRCHFFKRLEVQMVTRRISEHEGKLFPCLTRRVSNKRQPRSERQFITVRFEIENEHGYPTHLEDESFIFNLEAMPAFVVN